MSKHEDRIPAYEDNIPEDYVTSIVKVETLLGNVGSCQTTGDVERVDQEIRCLELFQSGCRTETGLRVKTSVLVEVSCDIRLTGPAPMTRTSTCSGVADILKVVLQEKFV